MYIASLYYNLCVAISVDMKYKRYLYNNIKLLHAQFIYINYAVVYIRKPYTMYTAVRAFYKLAILLLLYIYIYNYIYYNICMRII